MLGRCGAPLSSDKHSTTAWLGIWDHDGYDCMGGALYDIGTEWHDTRLETWDGAWALDVQDQKTRSPACYLQATSTLCRKYCMWERYRPHASSVVTCLCRI